MLEAVRRRRSDGSEAALGVGVTQPLRSLGPGPPGALPRAPLVSAAHHRGVRCSSGACPEWIPPKPRSARAGPRRGGIHVPQDPTARHRRAPLESFLTARSSREAHLSAQGPSPLPQARLPSSDVGPRRAGHHQGPSPQGPSSSVGLRRGTRRSTASPNVQSSPSCATPGHGVDTDPCRSSASSVGTPTVPRSRTQSHAEWATPSYGTACAGGSASPLAPSGSAATSLLAPIWSSLAPQLPRHR